MITNTPYTQNTLETLKIIIPDAVTIIGLISSYFLTKHNLKLELKKQLNNQFIDRAKSVEYDLAEILQLCIIEHLDIGFHEVDKIRMYFPFFIPLDKKRIDYFPIEQTNSRERIYRIFPGIANFSTSDTIKILIFLRAENDKEKNDINLVLGLISIINSQVRYEATGVPISPHDWLAMRSPYFGNKQQIMEKCQDLIDSNTIHIYDDIEL